MKYQEIGMLEKLERLQELNSRIPALLEKSGRAKVPVTVTATETAEYMEKDILFTKINIRPGTFSSTITLEIGCDQNKQVIVRMIGKEGKIIRLFGWYLLQGTNITTINDLGSANTGDYQIDVLDHSGSVIYTIELKKV